MKTRPFLMDFSRKALAHALPVLWWNGAGMASAANNPPPSMPSSPQCPLPYNVAIGLAFTIAALLIGVCVSFSRARKPYTHPEEEI